MSMAEVFACSGGVHVACVGGEYQRDKVHGPL